MYMILKGVVVFQINQLLSQHCYDCSIQAENTLQQALSTNCTTNPTNDIDNMDHG